MKNFYYIAERSEAGAADYLERKRQTVLETIKPICEAFGITDYDYIVKPLGQRETLVVEGVKIGCSDNSIGATVAELINYIWIKCGCIDRVYYYRKYVENTLTRHWL